MSDDVVVIGLGSNVEAERHLPAAVEALAGRLTVEGVSRVWESEPVGAPDTPTFLNAAVRVRTPLPPARLKAEVLRPLEAAAGRVRGPDRCAPRTLDLDVLLYGSRMLDEPERGLRIPDPDLDRLAHVAVPAAEAWPEGAHPASGEPLTAIARRLAAASTMRVRTDVDLAAAWRRGNKERPDA